MEFTFLIFVAGMISFLSPCILPMISVYFSLITGLSLADVEKIKQDSMVRRNIIVNTLAFVSAFIFVFTLAGALAGSLGKVLNINMSYFNIFGGIFIIVLALKQLGLLKLSFMQHISIHPDADRFTDKTNNQSLTAFLVGIFFAIVCSHCIGATLYSFLILAGNNGSALFGVYVMAVFSIGLALPYLLLAIFMNRFVNILRRLSKYQVIIRSLTGLILLLIGILMVTNRISVVFKFFQRVIPYELPIGM